MAVTLAAANADAQSGHHHQHAHTHGQANMNIVLEGDALFIEFRSPAANLLGFEHRPQNHAQVTAVAGAKALLAEGSTVLSLAGGGCTLASSEVDMGALGEQAMAPKDKEKGGARGHAAHADIVATYQFQCRRGEGLKSVEIILFEQFKGLEQVSAQWIVGGQQGSGRYQRTSRRLEF